MRSISVPCSNLRSANPCGHIRRSTSFRSSLCMSEPHLAKPAAAPALGVGHVPGDHCVRAMSAALADVGERYAGAAEAGAQAPSDRMTAELSGEQAGLFRPLAGGDAVRLDPLAHYMGDRLGRQ